MKSVFIGHGHYLPEQVVTNKKLSETVDTSDEWIVTRTGIKQRHFCGETETTSTMATKAANSALLSAGITPLQLDLIVVATVTPDNIFPAVATMVQSNIGATNAYAFDISAACNGYLNALAIADSFIKSGQAKTVLIIGADSFSKIIDMEDRSTCVLFGDGAGATILTASNSECGILGVKLHCDGDQYSILLADGGPSTSNAASYVRMNGREVYKHAVVKLAESAEQTLSEHGLSAEDIDWMIPHQANERIIDAVSMRLGLNDSKVIKTVSQHANTSAASIPLALSQSITHGIVKKGDLILHEAIGAGLVWGSALVRW